MKLSVWHETAESFYFLSLVTGPFMIYKWELRHPCYCNTIWCKDVRQLSLHRITTFKFPNDVAEQQLWLKAVLGVNGSAAKIEVPPNVQSLRVSAVHFFAEDLLHNKSGGIRLRRQSEKGGHNYGRKATLFREG